MLKKTGIITLAILYTFAVFGFALNFHFCGDDLYGVKVGSAAHSCCPKEVPLGKMKCCKDSKVDIKVTDLHQTESTSFLSRIFIIELPRISFQNYFSEVPQVLIEQFPDRGPPLLEKVAIYIKNCLFLI
ncbi:MAG: HYC_CC_PP family protein [Sphingobacteriaceae bacterium]